MKNALLASEERIFSRRSQRVRGKVLYYADNAMLTIRSRCPDLCVALTGSRRVHVKIIILVIIFFWVFLFFESNQHSEGVKCENDNEG